MSEIISTVLQDNISSVVLQEDVTTTVVENVIETTISGGVLNIAINGGTNYIFVKAGEDIGGQRVVKIENGLLYYFDASNVLDYGKALGVTDSAVIAGDVVKIFIRDEVFVSFPVTSGATYYAGALGAIQSTEGSVVSQKIGVGIDTNKIFVTIGEPIIL